jgi:hypothetical protein
LILPFYGHAIQDQRLALLLSRSADQGLRYINLVILDICHLGSTIDPVILDICHLGSTIDPVILDICHLGSTIDPVILNICHSGSAIDPLFINVCRSGLQAAVRKDPEPILLKILLNVHSPRIKCFDNI